ncbi:hypothetical protein AB7M49_000861 [Bradyrhizobium elkanii]|jgi:hypothetical protein|nr:MULTISPECIES: hypothetical protein [Bradyrhizobium]MCS3447414.1 hypothetical protein [Bradyrhizobium elkanii]MCS3561447.1 hypothetical protein [Bradyrhizobium elkanii]MCW2148710.1 hypothetical protein [Bradyrhizobium elkanii]MCW2352204.1 hypothetical protein [Bradyrhizobium elkanii]MCW2372439.1 hypothetical protein [Bradyrhizobium elkanii]
MPRFYFDLYEGEAMALDEEGLELKSVEAAQVEAAKSLADMARDAIHSRSAKPRDMTIDVRDEAGTIMQVRLVFDLQTKRGKTS